jgi:hypothetical protein
MRNDTQIRKRRWRGEPLAARGQGLPSPKPAAPTSSSWARSDLVRGLVAGALLALVLVAAPAGTTWARGRATRHGRAGERPYASGWYVVVGVAPDDVLQVRAAPSPRARSIGMIRPETEKVLATGPGRLVGRSLWVEVEHDGRRGWVNGRFLDRSSPPGDRKASGERAPPAAIQPVGPGASSPLTPPALAIERAQASEESAIFGGTATPSPAAGTVDLAPAGAAGSGGVRPPPGAAGEDARRDQANLGAAPARLPSEEMLGESPMTIGGQFYLKAQAVALQTQAPRSWTFSAPTLLDVFLDARPSSRVRGFVLGRLSFDSMQTASRAPGTGGPGTAPAAAMNGGGRDVRAALDQLWLRFDLARTVFVTAGRQHVRWGTARFWAPTDLLHALKRDPLEPFDARTGTTMLKLHLPWERRSWNFYAYGITEGSGRAPTVADLAGAARAEFVRGTAELGLGGLIQRGHKPRVAADLSLGVGPFDLYGEMALRHGSEIDRVRLDPSVSLSTVAGVPLSQDDLARWLADRYPVYRTSGIRPQVTAGLSFTCAYGGNDTVVFGSEYFYNGLGYDTPAVYPGLIFPRPLSEPATFFYLGRHYGALFVSLPSPGSWNDTTFSLSTLANLSDRTAITRFDLSHLILTYLRVEAFAALHYGPRPGEFRLAIPDLARPPALIDLGIALRVGV